MPATMVPSLQVASIVGGLNDEKNVQTSSSKRWEEILYPSRPLQLAMVAGWGVSFFQQAIGSEVGC